MIKITMISFLILLSLPSWANYQQIKEAVIKITDKNTINPEKTAFWIDTYSQKYNIDPFLMLALIKVESNFDQTATNSTGDYSLAQINYKIWKDEFKRIGLSLDFHKLKLSPSYFIEKMAQILNHLKIKHQHKDELWFARYHSKTKKYKKRYARKVKLVLNSIK